MRKNKLGPINSQQQMGQTGSRKCAADGTDTDQLHYLNAECPFWVLYYISMRFHSHTHRLYRQFT